MRRIREAGHGRAVLLAREAGEGEAAREDGGGGGRRPGKRRKGDLADGGGHTTNALGGEGMAEFRVRRRMEGRRRGWEWRQGRRVAFLVNGEAARCVRVGLG